MNKRWTWGAALLLLALVVGWAVQRQVSSRSVAPAPAAVQPTALMLTAQDLVELRERPLARGIEITGTLKAERSAFVKARVAGEILDIAVREGEAVRKGQVVARVDPTEVALRLRQAEQNAQAARAQLDIARRALGNSKALVAQGFVSPTTLDTAQANEAAADASLQAALAAVQLARKAEADATLLAPLSGLVAQRLAQPGERIGIDGRVLEIVDLSRLELEAAVPQDLAPRIQLGAPAFLRVDGLDAELSAQVARMNPSAQSGTRAVTVYLTVPPHPALRHGLFAHGRIVLEQRPALVLPLTAVRLDQAQPYVIEVIGTGDGALQTVQRPVTLGAQGRVDHAGGEQVEIVNGLAAGARVLTERAGLVRSGTPVTLAASASAP